MSSCTVSQSLPHGVDPAIASTAAPEPAVDTVSVCKNNDVTYLVSPDGATALKHADRSLTLAEMPAEQGNTTLPVSPSGLSLWQGAVVALLSASSWGVDRILDLCTVAQVAEYLRDDGALQWSVGRIASHLKESAVAKVVDGKPAADTKSAADADPSKVEEPAAGAEVLAAIDGLQKDLQAAVFARTAMQLPELVRAVPPRLISAVLQRHLRGGVLDISISDEPAGMTPFKPGADRPKPGNLPLDELASAISSLSCLKGLKISSGSITPEHIPQLSKIIEDQAATLQSISFWSPRGCEASIFRQSDSKLGPSVWQALSKCSMLTSLSLGRTNMHPSLAPALCTLLQQLQNLEALDLSDACGSLRLHSSSEVLPAITALTNLTELCFARNHLTRAACKHLAVTVSKLRKLRVLDVSGNSMLFQDAVLVFAVAASLPDMEELRAEDMGCFEDRSKPNPVYQGSNPSIFIEPSMHQKRLEFLKAVSSEASEIFYGDAANSNSDSKDLTTPLQSAQCKLRVLKLSSVSNVNACARDLMALVLMDWVCTYGSTSVSVTLPEQAPQEETCKPVDWLQNVEVLDLSSTPIAYATIPNQLLENLLSSLISLRDLNLSNCFLPPDALKNVCECLEKAAEEPNVPGLKSLNWSGNEALTSGSMLAVCSLRTLQRLVLQDCGIGEDLAKEMGKYVMSSQSLTHLDFSHNWMRSNGVVALAEACRHLPSLSYLHIGVAVRGDADLKAAKGFLSDDVTVEMAGGVESNEWVMESWQVAD